MHQSHPGLTLAMGYVVINGRGRVFTNSEYDGTLLLLININLIMTRV